MCRLLFAHQPQPFAITDYLRTFAAACKNSPAPDGDWQGDGWGVSWLENDNWQTKKNTQPIWTTADIIATKLPKTTTFMIHARSKSFSADTVDTEFNQPFIYNNLAFIFNGELRGVHLDAPGKIGAAKLFNHIQKFQPLGLAKSLKKTRSQLGLTVDNLIAANTIICNQKQVACLCLHNNQTPDYHTIHVAENDNQLLICSEKLMSLSNHWQQMENGEVVSMWVRRDSNPGRTA